jgi:hypothetical protein
MFIDPVRYPVAAAEQLTASIQRQAAGAEMSRQTANAPPSLTPSEVAELSRQAEQRERESREEFARRREGRALRRKELASRLLAVPDPSMRLLLAARHWAEDKSSVAMMFIFHLQLVSCYDPELPTLAARARSVQPPPTGRPLDAELWCRGS